MCISMSSWLVNVSIRMSKGGRDVLESGCSWNSERLQVDAGSSVAVQVE